MEAALFFGRFKNSVKERHHKVLLTNVFFAELQWWLSFIKVLNAEYRTPFLSPHPKRTPLLKEVEDITIETSFIFTGHLIYKFVRLNIYTFKSLLPFSWLCLDGAITLDKNVII